MQSITEPTIEVGDVIDAHHNFQNETLHFDAKYNKMIGLLNDISKLVQK